MKPITFFDDNDDEITLATKYEVCANCHGTGRTVNPSIDGHGLTNSDFSEDPDFRESYFAGAYDITCQYCQGKRVLLAVDYDNNSASNLAAYEQHVKELCDALETERYEQLAGD